MSPFVALCRTWFTNRWASRQVARWFEIGESRWLPIGQVSGDGRDGYSVRSRFHLGRALSRTSLATALIFLPRW
jgi:hypothetical protein